MRRRILVAAPLVIVLVAVLAALSFAAQRLGSQRAKPNRFRTHELSFAYPASWRRTDCRRIETEGFGTDTIVYLGSASSPPRCTKRGWLHQPPLHRDGVILMWGDYGNPHVRSLRRFPGKRIRVGGQPARIAIQPPSEGALNEPCSEVGGTRTVNVVIRFPQTAENWWAMTACLRGPHLSAREAQIHRMLASVKLKGPRVEEGVCGTPTTPVGRVVPDHSTVKIRLGDRSRRPLVSVRLQEPAKYLAGGYPKGFPWRMATSSNPEVLDPRSFCHPRGNTSVRITTFFSPGSANIGRTHLHAALSPTWRALRPSVRAGIAPYSSTVITNGRPQRRATSRR
jgi:hypothetical protein